MEAGFIALAIVMVVLGVIVGIYIGKTKAERMYANDTQYTQGTLNVDCVDPEFKPGLFLGLSVPVNDVISRKYIVLDVNVMLKDSHK